MTMSRNAFLKMHNFIEIKFTYHKMYAFKMYNSVVFSLFTMLCNHYHSLILEYFHHFKKKSHSH